MNDWKVESNKNNTITGYGPKGLTLEEAETQLNQLFAPNGSDAIIYSASTGKFTIRAK